MSNRLTGGWQLETWRRFNADGSQEYPFGEHPVGVLVYSADGSMAVQMCRADREPVNSEDPLGGAVEERATAYSTCLAYFGSYRVVGQVVIHYLQASLYPKWSGTEQQRPFELDGNRLVLKVVNDEGVTTNEIVWNRATPTQNEASI